MSEANEGTEVQRCILCNEPAKKASHDEAKHAPHLGKFCRKCLSKPARSSLRIALSNLTPIFLAVVYILCSFEREELPGELLGVGFFLLLYVGFLFFHEIAHAAVALLLGFRVFSIHFGTGPRLAWTTLLLGKPSTLQEAALRSADSAKILPFKPYVRGTRGSILVELGRVEEGVLLLKQAMGAAEYKGHRAISAYFLSRAYRRLGKPAPAARFLEKALSWDEKEVQKVAVCLEKGEGS